MGDLEHGIDRTRPMYAPIRSTVIRDLETCLRRIVYLNDERDRLLATHSDGRGYALPMADAWKDVANAYADELDEPHPEFKFLPKGSKPVDELWEAANQLDRDREKLEAEIGEYAYAMRAAVAWGNLREALRRNYSEYPNSSTIRKSRIVHLSGKSG